MLMKVSRWTRETFEAGSRPKERVVIGWIEAGEVPGRIIDGTAYVDAELFALQQEARGQAPVTAADLLS